MTLLLQSLRSVRARTGERDLLPPQPVTDFGRVGALLRQSAPLEAQACAASTPDPQPTPTAPGAHHTPRTSTEPR